jgi:beta-glucosidase
MNSKNGAPRSTPFDLKLQQEIATANMKPIKPILMNHFLAAITGWALFSAITHGQSGSSATASKSIADRLWLNKDATIDDRIKELLVAMTLEEKIGQLQQANSVSGIATGDTRNLTEREAFEAQIRSGELGSVLNEVDSATINRLQKLAVEESRLGIPLIFGRDVIHGFRTIFPIPLGQAASWNPQLAKKAAAVAAREARSVGVHWTFAPMVDIARDPRWGRIAESLGEDPYLASAFSAAMVRGYQGDDLSSPDRIAACAKHFAGYGAAEGGRDYNAAQISTSLLRNVYLPPFRAAVDANVATLMTAFNDVNGVPASANRYLLRDVLREDWQFQGFVVSDWESIEEMIEHGYSRDAKEAATAAIHAGVNMEMVSRTYRDHLAGLVKAGVISESWLDKLVADVLRVKLQLGLFERPYVQNSDSPLLAADHLRLARRSARQSVVLLKNEQVPLPLRKSKKQTLAVIGPLADAKRAQLGTWNVDGREEDSQTFLAAIRESAGQGVQVLHAPGLSDALDSSKDGFQDAIAAAQKADIVLLVVGEDANLSGEARSRANLDLPGAQNELVEAIATTGTPIVLIVQAGRPLTIGRQIDKVGAVLYSFHAGTMAGPALADLVWGEVSPSGKLPVTFPKAVGQVPLYYNHPNTGRPPRAYEFAEDSRIADDVKTDLGYNSNYIDATPYPLYPFGYGLTYTTFEYGRTELSKTRLRSGETLAIRAPVKNVGGVAATEVVQLYVRDVVGSIVRPVRELKAFRRVHVKVGETEVIEFAIDTDDLAYFNNDDERVLEPGKFEFYVGGNSVAPLVGEVEVVK